jgi:hypothetical protein
MNIITWWTEYWRQKVYLCSDILANDCSVNERRLSRLPTAAVLLEIVDPLHWTYTDSTCWITCKIWPWLLVNFLDLLLNCVGKFQFWLKSGKYNGRFTWRPICVSGWSLNIYRDEKIFRIEVVVIVHFNRKSRYLKRRKNLPEFLRNFRTFLGGLLQLNICLHC